MKLRWERAGIVTMTARVEEIAALVAGGWIAAAALQKVPGERGDELTRVLADFDRASQALGAKPSPPARLRRAA
ncbi:MAG TPA: hypothetical protein VGB52_03120 [Actinomycetota bacterium]